jgi:predicted Fe-S protein YdhL (DUF1289 family)
LNRDLASKIYRKMAFITDSAHSNSDPPSPCVGICTLNPQTQLCDGCLRTLDEIAAWWDYNPAQKQVVLDDVANRLARLIDGTYFD